MLLTVAAAAGTPLYQVCSSHHHIFWEVRGVFQGLMDQVTVLAEDLDTQLGRVRTWAVLYTTVSLRENASDEVRAAK